MSLAATLALPDFLDQQHDHSAGSSIYSPYIVSSLTAENNVPPSWVVDAAILFISPNNRQNRARFMASKKSWFTTF